MLDYPEGFTVRKMNPSNRGKNKRGLCLHKCYKSRTRRAKRQHVGGHKPFLRLSPRFYD